MRMKQVSEFPGATTNEDSEPRQIVEGPDDEFLIEEIDVVPVDSLLTMRC